MDTRLRGVKDAGFIGKERKRAIQIAMYGEAPTSGSSSSGGSNTNRCDAQRAQGRRPNNVRTKYFEVDAREDADE